MLEEICRKKYVAAPCITLTQEVHRPPAGRLEYRETPSPRCGEVNKRNSAVKVKDFGELGGPYCRREGIRSGVNSEREMNIMMNETKNNKINYFQFTAGP